MFWLGVVHLLLPLGMVAYVLAAPSAWDPYAFFYVTLLTLHWVLLRGECVLSYVYKRVTDPTYELGENVHLTDMEDVLRAVEKRTGWSYAAMRVGLDVLNYGALFGMLVRFVVWGTVSVVWVGLYLAWTVPWLVMLKQGRTLPWYDGMYMVVLVLLGLVVLKGNIR